MSVWINWLLWVIYLSLLGVLLPHTAWAFGRFEPPGWAWLGWVAAFAFEGAIAAFTWKLKQVIELAPKRGSAWLRWRRRYLNVYFAGLSVAFGVSSLANWAHSVEFGRDFAVFGVYSVPPLVFSVAFGGILPVCSVLFARVLANVVETEVEPNPELAQAKKTIAELRRRLQQAEMERKAAEERAKAAEQRFAAAGDLFARLMAESKRDRILAVVERWPQLPPSAVAIIAEASPSYVSEVLREVNGDRKGDVV